MSSPFEDESADLEVPLLNADKSTAPVTASAPPAGTAGGGQDNSCTACHERTRRKGACEAASTGRCSRRCQLAACVTAMLLAVCTTIAILYYPRTPHLTFEGRSALHLDWPYFKNGLVLINFKMILAINNPNRYDVYFSNTEIEAFAYNSYSLGTVSEPKTLVLRHGEKTELTFDTHGAASIREGLELVVDCISNNLFTNVTAKGFIDVHIGPALRLRHSVPPLKVHFPCVLHGDSGHNYRHEL